jgi:hypothetical protein
MAKVKVGQNLEIRPFLPTKTFAAEGSVTKVAKLWGDNFDTLT